MYDKRKITNQPIKDNTQLSVLKFDAAKLPTPYESYELTDERMVIYGYDNRYPEYLLSLYNDCPMHSSIIKGKANYIIGEGLKFANGNAVDIKINAVDSFNDLVSKVVKDYLIFNYFCIEVTYNKFNQPIEYHYVPAHKIRTNKSRIKFWFSESFFYRHKIITFDRWKEKTDDSTTKLFFFAGPSSSINNVYPEPDYAALMKTLQTDIEIRNFNLNNIQNHFSVSTLITFFRGSNVSDEIKQKVVTDLKASYTGATGKKMIVDFQDPNQPSADVKNISPNDWDKVYDLIGKKVNDDIISGHQITSPMLFGVKTEGQLGGASELETSYEIFKNTYVKSKRLELESALNLLFSNTELIKGKLAFVDKQLFSARISETLKEKIYTINELRKEAGLEPMTDGDRLLTEIPHITESIPAPAVQASKFSSGTEIKLSDEDYEKIKDLGVLSDSFEFVDDGEFITTKEDFKKVELQFETQQEIADYIVKNDVSGMSLKDIKSAIRKSLAINITINELKTSLQNIHKSGIANVEVNGDTVWVKNNPEQAEVKRQVEVLYSYQVRDGLGEPIIETTRPFCRRLIENNKLYTLEEIQSMSSIFGYDIFMYGGGYYHNPETDTTTSFCRHKFKSKYVVRKSK